MSHPAQIAPQPPHHPGEVAGKPKNVQLTPAQPMTVAYQAWPLATPVGGEISSEIIAYHQPEHATSKEYALLLDAMLKGVKPNCVMLLVGAKPKVGASTVLLNLAVIAAQKKL